VGGFFGLLLLAAAGRLVLLVVPYLGRYPAIPRFPIESAATLFVVLGLLVIALGRAESPPAVTRPTRSASALWIWIWFAFAALTLIVFAPTLDIGFLSDDYPLFARAGAWNLGAFNADAFRPLPLALWGVIHAVGGGAVAVHMVNLLIHVTNAVLTTVIAAEVLPSRWAPFAAGLLVALLPANVEAVVWSSGVFDLCATLFVLSAVIVGRGYGVTTTKTRRASLYLLVVAGVLSKEAAVVAPVLLALDAVARRAWSKPLAIDVTVMTLLGGAYGVARFSSGSAMVHEPINRYLIQRFVFNLFGTLSVPWHARVIANHSALAVGSAVCTIALLTWFFLGAPRRQAVSTVAFAAWVLVAALPTLTFFYVAPTLEGSRYLYLSGIGWAVVVGGIVDAGSRVLVNPWPRALLFTTVLGLLVVDAVGVRLHLQPWIAAAALRDRVEQAAVTAASEAACATLAVSDLPDAVDGAFVLRNGGVEALLQDRGLRVRLGSAPGACAVRWDGTAFVRTK
jgi:hypothetical protein